MRLASNTLEALFRLSGMKNLDLLGMKYIYPNRGFFVRVLALEAVLALATPVIAQSPVVQSPVVHSPIVPSQIMPPALPA